MFLNVFLCHHMKLNQNCSTDQKHYYYSYNSLAKPVFQGEPRDMQVAVKKKKPEQYEGIQTFSVLVQFV